MEIADFFHCWTSFEKSILKTTCNKECLIITFEIGKNLNHPINHSGTKCWGYLVSIQVVGGIIGLLKLSEISINICSKLVPNIYVLALNFSWCHSWQMPCRVLLSHETTIHEILIAHKSTYYFWNLCINWFIEIVKCVFETFGCIISSWDWNLSGKIWLLNWYWFDNLTRLMTLHLSVNWLWDSRRHGVVMCMETSLAKSVCQLSIQFSLWFAAQLLFWLCFVGI